MKLLNKEVINSLIKIKMKSQLWVPWIVFAFLGCEWTDGSELWLMKKQVFNMARDTKVSQTSECLT